VKKTSIKLLSTILIFTLMLLPFSTRLFAVEVTENEIQTSAIDSAKVLETRFLNMLNHNYVYGDDIGYYDSLIKESVVALLDMREDENSSYISQEVVNGYLFDMYGVTIEDFSQFLTDFPYKEGYVYIIPRGYTEYKHSAVSISENEDGTFNFETQVIIDAHDGETEFLTCNTVFVRNDASAFGFNILRSEFIDNHKAI